MSIDIYIDDQLYRQYKISALHNHGVCLTRKEWEANGKPTYNESVRKSNAYRQVKDRQEEENFWAWINSYIDNKR